MERKSIILFVFLALTVFCKAQDGGYRANKLQITATNTYFRLAIVDPLGVILPFPNGTTGQVLTMGTNTPTWGGSSGYILPIASSSVLGGVKIGTGISIDGSGVIVPTWGTSHTTSAYGDHLHSGVYDNYGSWGISDGTSSYQVYSNNSVNPNRVEFYGGTAISRVLSNAFGEYNVTYELDILSLTTNSNPTLGHFVPIESTSGTTSRITLSAIEWVIGTTAGTADRLIKRDASGDAYAHNFILSSDRRVKQEIKPLKKLDWVNGIKFVQFESKNDSTHRKRYGVIAQDVEKINPNLVYIDEKGMKSVGYTDLIIAKLAAMEQKINDLETEVKYLHKKVKRHEK